MKLSVEAKVAAAVAAAFLALTVAAIGQGGSESQNGDPNNYRPTDSPGMDTQVSEQAYNNSLGDRTKLKTTGSGKPRFKAKARDEVLLQHL